MKVLTISTGLLFAFSSLCAQNQPTRNIFSDSPGVFVTSEGDSIFFPADLPDQLPEPYGGVAEIQRHVKYPTSARKFRTQGIVYVSCLFDERGTLTHTRILRGVGDGCNEASINAIRSVKFAPARLNGKPVKWKVLIPIRFRLSN